MRRLRRDTIAFMIWRVAAPLEWNVTAAQVSALIDEPDITPKSVAQVCRVMGWGNRIRSSKKERTGQFMPDPAGFTEGTAY